MAEILPQAEACTAPAAPLCQQPSAASAYFVAAHHNLILSNGFVLFAEWVMERSADVTAYSYGISILELNITIHTAGSLEYQ
jgi:hypothetical protein